MDTYKTRHITFKELISVDDWSIKIYTISVTKDFNNTEFYQTALDKLPEWLEMENSFNAKNDKIGFLILHEATEGIFSIINWWVGKNMLNTNVFLSEFKTLNKFKKISGDGLGPCVWELEIINHERLAWIDNILKQPTNRDYNTYLNDTITCEL